MGDEDNYNDTPTAIRANFITYVGGGGGKEPDKKPDKDPKKIAEKILTATAATAVIGTMLSSSTNNKNTTNNVISPFDPNTITRTTDTGTGQVVIEYKDGTRRIFDKKAVPDSILAKTTMGVDGINAEGSGKANLRNIEDYIAGNKNFDDVIDDYARLYAEQVNSNSKWQWDEDILGGENLTRSQKAKIKERAVVNGEIVNIKITKVDGKTFADFKGAGVVRETVELPEEMWLLSDKEQFKWLDEQIGGHVDGYTWHHSEIPGEMQLVPFGIHNVTNHNGGRTKGMWADAAR